MTKQDSAKTTRAAAPGPRGRYDVAIVGNQIGGLLAASMARARGMSVIVIPGKDPSPGFAAQVGVTDCEPNVLLRPEWMKKAKLEGARAFSPAWVNRNQRVLIRPGRKLGEELAFGDATDPPAPKRAVEWERLRSEGDAALSKILKFRAREEEDSIEPVAPSHFGKRIQPVLKRFAKGLPATRSQSETCAKALTAALGLGPSLMPSRSASLPLLAALADRCVSFRGGSSSYRRSLQELAAAAGVEFLDEGRVTELKSVRGEGFLLSVEGRREPVASDAVIFALPLREAQKLTGARLKRAPQPKAFWFTTEIEADSEAFAARASDHSIWLEDGAPPLWIEVVDAEEYGADRRGKKILFLRTPVAFGQASKPAQDLELLSKRMRRVAFELFPFLERHAIKPATTGGWANWKPDTIPESIGIFGSPGRGTVTGLKGTWLCGSESFPEHGVVGPELSAAVAVSQIFKQKVVRERKAKGRSAGA